MLIHKVEDIAEFSFLTIAVLISVFMDSAVNWLSYITYDILADGIGLGIQFFVLLTLIKKFFRNNEKK